MTELQRLSGAISDLKAGIVAISADAPQQSRQFSQEMRFDFPLLCDDQRTVIQQFHLLNPHEHGGIAYPAIFIVKPGGIIGYRSLDRTANRVNLSEILQYLENVESDPDLLQQSQSPKKLIIPNLKELLQVGKNMFKRGNATDWKHYLTYPYILLKMPFRK